MDMTGQHFGNADILAKGRDSDLLGSGDRMVRLLAKAAMRLGARDMVSARILVAVAKRLDAIGPHAPL